MSNFFAFTMHVTAELICVVILQCDNLHTEMNKSLELQALWFKFSMWYMFSRFHYVCRVKEIIYVFRLQFYELFSYYCNGSWYVEFIFKVAMVLLIHPSTNLTGNVFVYYKTFCVCKISETERMRAQSLQIWKETSP